MTIAQIKTQLGVAGFNFSRCMTKDPNDATKEIPTEFLRHWDAKNRFSFVVHQDVLAKAKENPNGTKFALKYEQRATKDTPDETGKISDTAGLAYDSYILIWSDKIEDSL